MKITEMFDRVLLMSGVFLMPQDKVELNIQNFKLLVEMTVGVYNGYVPRDLHARVPILSSRQYTFTDAFSANGEELGIPEYVIDALPVRISGVVPYFFTGEYQRPPQTVTEKVQYPFVYRKPVLTVPASAEYDLHLMYFHKVTKVQDSEDWEVKTLSDADDEFLELLQAKFMMALGRSRRAFTMQDLPITVDASDLVAEGKALEEEAMEEIKEEKGKWYLAWR